MPINVSKSGGSYIPKPSANKGGVLIFNGTDWVALNPPGDGYVLTSDSTVSAGAAWKNPGTSGGGTGGQTGLLKWAPPAQTTPTVVNVSTSDVSESFGETEDAIFVMPTGATFHQQIAFTGGRQIRIIGGKFDGSGLTEGGGGESVVIDGADMGAVNGGKVGFESLFLEGLDIDLSGQHDLDMIWMGGEHSALNASHGSWNRPLIYAQNCRFGGALWSGGGHHPDIIQKNRPLAGVRMYNCTLTWSYQGLFLPPQEGTDDWYQGGTSLNDIDRVNLIARPDRAAFGLWLNWDSNGGVATNTPSPLPHTTLGDVWIQGKTGDQLGSNVAYPRVVTGTSEAVNSNPGDVGMIVAANGLSATWKPAARIDGTLKYGTPPGGDFCPVGVAGLSYSSPGYAS